MAFGVSNVALKAHYKALSTALIIMVVLITLQPFLWRFAGNRALGLQQKRSQDIQIKNVQRKNEVIAAGIVEQSEALSQLDLVSPPAGTLTPIVERLEKLADQRGLEVEILSIKENDKREALLYKKLESLTPVAISIKVRGPVDRTLSYLDQVEHIQELSLITDWALQESEIGAGSFTAPTVGKLFDLRTTLIFFLRNDG